MNFEILISKIIDLFFLNHTVQCIAWMPLRRDSRADEYQISAFMASKGYSNTNFIEEKQIDLHWMIINT